MCQLSRVSLAALVAIVFLAGTALPAQATEPFWGGGRDAVQAIDDDGEDIPDVTARVARISFIRGDARIRRTDSEDWESVTLNLPVVEGDEIVTDTGSRLELQLAKDQHLRLGENSHLKVVTLRDAGVAVRLSLGAMHVRILSFDRERAFFEVDAPRSTVSLQAAGDYRFDAGEMGDQEIRIAVLSGEARIYSDTAGFTLKSGRRARLFIDGPMQGEWESGDAMAYLDEFDRWSTDRDRIIAQRLSTAYYDRYYDSDIYGADDLGDHGQWIHTRDYGYVWRPYSSAISGYADWSPYRYGHWRWLPPFGWTWVNDEPWGWATYHHGRWFYHGGHWVWSPYGYYRSSRSWWRPALVVITVVRNNICWYPLSYRHAYYNFNRHYHRRRHSNTGDRVRVPVAPLKNREIAGSARIKGQVPPIGVVGTDEKEFGSGRRAVSRMPRDIAETVLAKDTADRPPELPPRERVKARDIVAERPKRDLSSADSRVGAARRRADAPLDVELRNTRVFGGRPIQEARPAADDKPRQRPTGIFERPPTQKERPPMETPADMSSPRRIPPPIREAPGTEVPPAARPRRDVPVVNEPVPRQYPSERAVPRREPPAARDTPRSEPPAERPVRREPPAAREAPRQAPPTSGERPRTPSAPVREKPKSDPPAAESPKSEQRQSPRGKKADPIDR